jgi:hypothetical protein
VLGSKLAVIEPRFAVAFCLRIAAPKRDFNHNRHGYSGREHVEVGAIGEAGALGLINSTTASAIAEMASRNCQNFRTRHMSRHSRSFRRSMLGTIRPSPNQSTRSTLTPRNGSTGLARPTGTAT